MDVKVWGFDDQGNVVERSWEWAVERYGIGLVEADPPQGETVYRLAELRQKVGPCGQVVRVVDENGAPLEGVAVMQGWVGDDDLDAEAAPRLSDTVWEQPYNKANRGCGVFTNGVGDAGFGWGDGEQYLVENTEGPHWYWILPGGLQVYTDVVLGFGWLWGSDHDTLNITFKRAAGEDDGDDNGDDDGDDGEEPPVVPENLEEAVLYVGYAVEAVASELAKLREMLGGGWVIKREE